MTIFSEVWNAQVTETECRMLGVERACMESAGKAAYLWKAWVWKVHVKLRQQSGKECTGKESAFKLETTVRIKIAQVRKA